MKLKKKDLKLLYRLIFWLIYFTAGFILYSKNQLINDSINTFAKVFYPISIFWIQIRINKKERWLPIDSKMASSQLWFRLLPILASLLTLIISLIKLFIFIFLQF